MFIPTATIEMVIKLYLFASCACFFFPTEEKYVEKEKDYLLCYSRKDFTLHFHPPTREKEQRQEKEEEKCTLLFSPRPNWMLVQSN